MANVREYRRRIKSVKSTQQITRAMKLVAAASLRRSQERVISARPYAKRMLAVLNSLATRVKAQATVDGEENLHPLLRERPENKIALIVITGDRGLCGAFNNNIVSAASDFIERHKGKDVSLTLVGKRGRDFFRKRPVKRDHEYVNILAKVTHDQAKEIAAPIIEAYAKAQLDAVYLVYNEFKTVMQQRVAVEKLLPITRLELSPGEVLIDYIYEQPPQKILSDLLPKHVEVQFYRAFLESVAAEHAARMTAMDNATNNAEEMISTLTLVMNKIRQASITKELIEIVSGANALAASTK